MKLGKRFWLYWAIAWVFSVIVIEFIISGIILPKLGVQYSLGVSRGIVVAVYYAVLCGVFALLYSRVWRRKAAILIVPGAAALYGLAFELLIAKTIHGIGEAIGFMALYAFMFWVPFWATGRLLSK